MKFGPEEASSLRALERLSASLSLINDSTPQIEACLIELEHGRFPPLGTLSFGVEGLLLCALNRSPIFSETDDLSPLPQTWVVKWENSALTKSDVVDLARRAITCLCAREYTTVESLDRELVFGPNGKADFHYEQRAWLYRLLAEAEIIKLEKRCGGLRAGLGVVGQRISAAQKAAAAAQQPGSQASKSPQ